MLTRYYATGTCARASHIALEPAGAQYQGVRDGSLFRVSRWLEGDGVDLRRLPRVLAHRERVGAIPAVATVLCEEAA